jgi:hypothetical protein
MFPAQRFQSATIAGWRRRSSLRAGGSAPEAALHCSHLSQHLQRDSYKEVTSKIDTLMASIALVNSAGVIQSGGIKTMALPIGRVSRPC